ncbi:MAG: Glutamyl-tRNA(Gln) amidotransferase subunit C [Deltaproteobacteria bacterium ADurb.Bin510]|nr:MAG: Glutamyl-tRNA(Gln) amidotransferase subunit C [Deltaproteobacteria bacterium ADurb.Bin510]
MKITEDEIRRIASLANLEPDLKLAGDLNAILDYMDLLGEVETAGVEPSYSPLKVTGQTRPDEPRAGLEAKAVTGIFTFAQDGGLSVPRVLE